LKQSYQPSGYNGSKAHQFLLKLNHHQSIDPSRL